MEHNSRRALRAPSIIIALFFIVAAALIPASFLCENAYAEADGESVYLGGMPIGIRMVSDGLIVVEYVGVITKDGAKTPALSAGIQKGDMLTELNGRTLKEVTDITEAIGDSLSPMPYKLVRGAETVEGSVTPVTDIVTNSPKIGLMVKNDVAGVGTVSFVKEDGRMCTLGHMISDGARDAAFFKKGSFYRCNILGVVKSAKNAPGALKGVFNRNGEAVGNIDSNSDYGVYGYLSDKSFVKDRPKVQIGNISDVKPGKASVYTTLEGNSPSEYEVEIVKYETQTKPEIKGLVLRVTDSVLLDKAAGIVQGMSGSPIVQNGKLVGAITHVFVNDPVYGYGIYAAWMSVQ